MSGSLSKATEMLHGREMTRRGPIASLCGATDRGDSNAPVELLVGQDAINVGDARKRRKFRAPIDPLARRRQYVANDADVLAGQLIAACCPSDLQGSVDILNAPDCNAGLVTAAVDRSTVGFQNVACNRHV